MTGATSPSVFTVPPGIAMVDALAEGLLQRCEDGVQDLGDVTVLLPTRRACRSLAEAFLRRSGGKALLLPQIRPLGEMDDADTVQMAEEEPAGGLADLPPAIPDLTRSLALCRLILRTGDDGARNPAGAALLARALGDLLDEVQTERLEFDGLEGLVESDLAAHWQITLDFLRILTEHWPMVLEEYGCLDPSARRNELLDALAARWEKKPPPGPVFAAGSTGSIPATAALLDVIAHLPQGQIILPGYDTGLSADARAAIGPTHPQYGMIRLLERIGADPEDIRVWSAGLEPACPPERVALIRSALRPPLSEADASAPADLSAALGGVSVVDCPGPQEEAGVIALAMRQALETPGRTAALVTPDRSLARRVASELQRWDISIDDSAGRPLSSTPVGSFLRLVADCVAQAAAPVPLLSLLKHPLASGRMATPAFRARVRNLEIAVLRGPRPDAGFDAVADALDMAGAADKPLADWFRDVADKAEAFAALLGEPAGAGIDALLDAHLAFAEWLAATDEISGDRRLWVGEDGEAVATFVAELRDAAGQIGEIGGADYPGFLDVLMRGRVVRPRYGMHPRLHIWGLLEARLQHADLVCLGGLNEGTWPVEPDADPWMSRPMRARFGLPPAERRIGQSAHDFTQHFCAEQVLITRAARIGGTPTVPARWLLRLDNTLKAAGGEAAVAQLHRGQSSNSLLRWQQTVNEPPRALPMTRPAPTPPLTARPRQLSVTQVETWMRDPYAIYARHILGLKRIEPIDADPGAADRGTMIHEALDRFVQENPDRLPEDMLGALIEFGDRAFGKALAQPGVRAFWWPRYLAIADWFAALERQYRETVAETHTEVSGALEIAGPAGKFRLIAKADRVDRLRDGTLSIIDYKTGAAPRRVDVELGFAPQLPLEAAIAFQGGFEDIPGAPVSCLEFWRLTGGNPAGERIAAGDDIDQLARSSIEGLERLVARFDDAATPYLSQPDTNKAPRFSDYEHLARVQEWSVVDSGGDE